jgi:phosphatidate phosphatase APP1
MTETSTLPAHSNLKLDQQVDLFPTFAYPDPKRGSWRLLVAGFTFCSGESNLRQRMFLRLLRQVLRIDEEQLKANPVFQERIVDFLTDPQRATTIVVRLKNHDSQSVLRKSRRNGHFRGGFVVPQHDLHRACPELNDVGMALMPYGVLLPPDDKREVAGYIQVLAERGVSVISDIDDTIKISQVAHRRQLLHNTFLHPFVAVPGMAELYQSWAAQGAAFHYVSSSPWQLFRPLSELFEGSNFPKGSFHLRSIRFGDPSVMRLFVSRKRNKYHVIRTIFRLFPKRRFVLVGDSGEKDPEIYGTIARKFPNQIERIIIRRVVGRRWTRKRVAKAFRNIPRELWQTFRVPTQVKEVNLRP